jgi:dolichol-phosphate mannosyltransferase
VPSISIVVPIYNERDNAPGVVGELLAWARARVAAGGMSAFELVLVDDGSTDGSIDAVRQALGTPPELRVVTHARNQSLTAALRTGFSAALLELVTWVPADGQIPPSAIGQLLAAWHGEALVISTYRRRDDGPLRTLLTRGSRLVMRAIIGFGERFEGTYLFRRDLLDAIALVTTRSSGIVAFEIAAKTRRLGLPITSTEIECLPRRSGRSKVANMKNVADFVAELIRIRRSM